MLLPAASFATWLSAFGAVAAAVAAAAALFALRYAGQTVRYAHETVLKADEAMSEVAVQHAEQIETMTALTRATRDATAATAIQELTEAEHRQVAQVQRIAELVLQTEEAADEEAKRSRPDGAPSRLPLMLRQIHLAKNAWFATADLEGNPYAAALQDLRPLLMDAKNPLDVWEKCMWRLWLSTQA